MAQPNYSFEKRQRDIARKKKQDAKRLARMEKKSQGSSVEPGAETEPPIPSA